MTTYRRHRDQKTQPEVNSRDVIKRKSGTKVSRSQILEIFNQIWHRAQAPYYHHGKTCHIPNYENPRWRRPPY